VLGQRGKDVSHQTRNHDNVYNIWVLANTFVNASVLFLIINNTNKLSYEQVRSYMQFVFNFKVIHNNAIVPV